MVREHFRAHHDFLEGDQHLLQRDLRQRAGHLPVLELRRGRPDVTLEPRQRIDPLGGALEALVFLQAPDQLRARILLDAIGRDLRPRQQHARFDLRERGRHHQVLARELELQVLHQLDVAHVLARDLR